MKISVDAKELKPGSDRGNLSRRLVFADERWNKLDVCVHGQRLRWQCMERIDFLEKPKPKKPT